MLKKTGGTFAYIYIYIYSKDIPPLLYPKIMFYLKENLKKCLELSFHCIYILLLFIHESIDN